MKLLISFGHDPGDVSTNDLGAFRRRLVWLGMLALDKTEVEKQID
jgi:hypothetical protein